LVLGGDGMSGDQLNGGLDEVAIYDHALSVPEVLAHAAAANLAPDYEQSPDFAAIGAAATSPYMAAYWATWFDVWNSIHATAVAATAREALAQPEYLTPDIANRFVDLYRLRDLL